LAVVLSSAPLAAKSARFERAMSLVERNDVNELPRLLKEDPSLVQRTDAGVLPHWNWTLLHRPTADTSSAQRSLPGS
jgi:hypothetical protein